ncbi:hypothetical protein NI465_12155 [Acinetobacter lwoffii]|uniref:hypothetical protein n=1 Tax=Acinetobacter lwoffii TaxID=28090 RepID=UPI00209A74AD|nr:hypothetical protein [Acinetobacter lwoffii]MCO8114924.1 hypothetical protein [Acinetobacter lwoffii]
MSDVNDDDTLNEFEYSQEELAELAKLNELNDDSDELTPVPAEEETAIVPGDDSEDLELDDDFVDDLLNPGEVKTEPEPAKQPDPEPTPEPEIEPEPAPDFDDQLEESTQRVQEAQGNIDDTLSKLSELAEQYDDGEISQGKYDIKKLELERELHRHEKVLDKVEQAHEALEGEANNQLGAYQETRRNAWRNDLVGFLEDPANAVIANNQHVAEQFDALLQSMGQSGVFEGLNNQQVLQSVRNQLSFRVPELSKTTYNPQTAKEKPPKPTQKANIPASLSQMSAQEMPTDDPFAYLRKLSGVAYEQALSKLTPEQSDAYTFGMY